MVVGEAGEVDEVDPDDDVAVEATGASVLAAVVGALAVAVGVIQFQVGTPAAGTVLAEFVVVDALGAVVVVVDAAGAVVVDVVVDSGGTGTLTAATWAPGGGEAVCDAAAAGAGVETMGESRTLAGVTTATAAVAMKLATMPLLGTIDRPASDTATVSAWPVEDPRVCVTD